MDILKPGKIFKDFKYFKCPKCECVFRAEKGEWNYTSQLAQLHDGCGPYECDCPSCGYLVDGNGVKIEGDD